MSPNLSYRKYSEELKCLDPSPVHSGNSAEGAKRLAFLLIWLQFQFGWRLNRWESGISRRHRPWIYFGILLFLAGLVLLPLIRNQPDEIRQVPPVAITLPMLPTDPVFAPDTLLNQISLKPLHNEE